jgi:hypothetical protein
MVGDRRGGDADRARRALTAAGQAAGTVGDGYQRPALLVVVPNLHGVLVGFPQPVGAGSATASPGLDAETRDCEALNHANSSSNAIPLNFSGARVPSRPRVSRFPWSAVVGWVIWPAVFAWLVRGPRRAIRVNSDSGSTDDR